MTQIDEVLVCGVRREASDVEISPGQRLSLLGRHPPGVRGRRARSSSSIIARWEGRGDAREKMAGASVPAQDVRPGSLPVETTEHSPGPGAEHLLTKAWLDRHLGQGELLVHHSQAGTSWLPRGLQ